MSKSGKQWKIVQAKRRKNRRAKQEGNTVRISEGWNHAYQQPKEHDRHRKAA